MSDTAPDTGTDPTPDQNDTPEPDTGVEDIDWKAEAEKYKALHRKQEERAKANANAAKELEAVKLASLSDQEKAVEIARQQARAEVLTEVGGQLVDMAVRAAVNDRGIDADALLDGLDRTRFLSDDGKADTDAITAWVDRIAPRQGGIPDLGQGARTKTPALGSDPLLQALKNTVGIR